MGVITRVTQARVREIVTDVGDPTDTTTDSLHGKLGTDAEMSDSSIFDLLGGNTAVQGFPVMVAKATATLPQSTAGALFTITVGNIELLAIVGEVTTVIQTQACATKLTYNPTATGASTDICTTQDITADAVGTLYSITGVLADPLQSGLLVVHSLTAPLIMAPGTIDLDCAASNTGSVQWYMIYRPIEAGATVA